MITNEKLNEERKIFVGGFALIILATFVLSKILIGVLPIEYYPSIPLIAKAFFVYLVFRLSRFLNQPIWLTIIYCILAPFSLLYLIPFIGLLIEVKRTRKKITCPI